MLKSSVGKFTQRSVYDINDHRKSSGMKPPGALWVLEEGQDKVEFGVLIAGELQQCLSANIRSSRNVRVVLEAQSHIL